MPVGFFEGTRSVDGGRVVTGWTVDPDTPDVPVQIEVEIDGVVVGAGQTTVPRNDVSSAYPGAANSGFEILVEAAEGELCVFALDDATDHRTQLPSDSSEYYPTCP